MDIVLQGLVFGIANGLLAAGIVLIYMSNRTINFAQGEFGAFAVAVMFALSNRAHWPYAVALLVTLTATGALGAVVELGVVRRLFTSPRLILLIATVGVAQIITASRAGIPTPQTQSGDALVFGGASTFPLPFHTSPVEFGRVVLHTGDLLVLVVGPLVALALFAFLRWSPYGVALRAAAENAQRARLLGIPVRRVSTLAWVTAAVLAGIAAILLAPVIGYSSDPAVGLSLLFRGLAAATIAGLGSVGAAFGVGVALGVADELTFVWTGQSGLTDLVLFVAVVVALLARRDSLRGASSAAESAPDTGEPIRPLSAAVKAHRTWSRMMLGSVLLAFAIVVVLPFVLPSHDTFYVAATVLMVAAVISVTVLTGWAGQLSLGQWAIAGAGGLVGVKLYSAQGVPFWIAFVAAIVIGAVVAVVIGLPALRLHGFSLAVVTLAFTVLCSSWLYNRPVIKSAQRIEFPAYLTTRWQYVAAFVLLAVVVVAMRWVDRGPLGRAIRAVRDNPVQAASFGFSVTRTKLTAFGVSGAVAGASGFLFINVIGAANPSIFPPVNSLALLAAAVIGGLGSIGGAIIGGVYIFAVQYFAAEVFPEQAAVISLLTTGVGLLALLLMLPGGLIRPLVAARDWMARRVTGLDPHATALPQPPEPPAGVRGELDELALAEAERASRQMLELSA